MRQYRRIVCVLLSLAALAFGSVTTSAQAQPKLVVFPDSGRPNDAFFLAGNGFPSGHPLEVDMFCPNPFQDQYGQWKLRVIPGRQIRHGSFAGVELHVPTPYFNQTNITCVIDTPYGYDPLGTPPARFRVLSRDQSAPTTTFPIAVRVRSASRVSDTIDVRSVPGSHLVFKVYYPGTTRLYRTQLPWTGHATLRWRVPRGVHSGLRVRMAVHGTLGSLVGDRSLRFFIRR